MGLLVVGTPLTWEQSLEHLKYVREHGVMQFLKVYQRVKDICEDDLKWGDELEYGVFKLDAEKRSVRLSLRAHEILKELEGKERTFSRKDEVREACHWHPEYGNWMVEATPRVPYAGFASDLHRVETNMRLRRARLIAVLGENEIAPTVTCFPLMGVNGFTEPLTSPCGPLAMSDYVSDEVINPHPRFGTLTANIRKRRGRKVDIRVPVFNDVHTHERSAKKKKEDSIPSSTTWVAEHSRTPAISNGRCLSPATFKVPAAAAATHEKARPSSILLATATAAAEDDDVKRELVAEIKPEPHPGFIHMDCMAFGMGMCCLQVTFQAKNIDESRHLYDHLAVLAPILLALTAATPILKGKLADTDVRWATIAASVDDRTPEELGSSDDGQEGNKGNKKEKDVERAKYMTHMAGGGVRRVKKSRYDSISTYICNHKSGGDPCTSLDNYNDIDLCYDEESYDTLRSHGIDETLAKHIAHLFVRDPLVMFSERIRLNDDLETDHFESIQSTNWQTVRWKPPPQQEVGKESHIGWRTEFRSMEVQLTDFENAAFAVFVVLVSRVILAFDLNLYIPLSKVDANMEIAHRRNAIVCEKFFFRSHLAPPEDTDCSKTPVPCNVHASPNQCEAMTIAEIMLGKGNYFPGLIPLVNAYLDHIECDDETKELVTGYLKLIQKRSTGELPTTATWMRRFVQAHPDYAHDSVVPSSIVYDLLKECKDIGEGRKQCPELLGDIKIDPIKSTRPYEVPLHSKGMNLEKRRTLLQRYTSRSREE